MTDALHKSEESCAALLNKIFDAAPLFLQSIAPEGWAQSPYVHFLHPTPQQQYEMYLHSEEVMKMLSKDKPYESDNKQLTDFAPDDLSNVPEHEEYIYMLGLSVWDIFSNNHEVYDDEGIYDLGSFRGSAGFIADFIDTRLYSDAPKYTYMDFYMGTSAIDKRADLLPFYEFIFRILQAYGCDWNYHFPRMFAFNVGGNDDAAAQQNISSYNPGEAVEAELEKAKKEEELKKFQEELEMSFQKEYDEAKYQPLIPVIQAYKNVFGNLPDGHPQKEFE